MNDKRRHLCLAHMGGEEMSYIQRAFDTNWVVPLGPNVDEFESLLEDYLGESKHVAALSSGTAALHLAMVLLGISPGDEVICQSFTFAASANPIVYCGAVPVFVDSEPDSWNMSPSLLEDAIMNRIEATGHAPKAIIVVDLYGMPARLDDIVRIAHKYNIPLIEDAAEALGSEYKGRKCGTFGDLSVLSFNGNKMITTSGGGALVCPDISTKKRAIFYATQAREPERFYHHKEIGYNYRLSNISAGIGCGQMKILDQHIEIHKAIADTYREAFANDPHVVYHDNPSPCFDSNFWLSTVLFRGGLKMVEKVMDELDIHNIESRRMWKPMHLQPVFEDCLSFTDGVSDSIFNSGLCLPSGPMLSIDDDIIPIIDIVKRCVRE